MSKSPIPVPMLRPAAGFTCLLLTLAVLPWPSTRAAAQTGSRQPTDNRLVRNEEGFSLDLAGGFELGKYFDGYYLLGSRTIPGLILVKDLPGLTAAELNRNLRSGYTDRTVQLTPDGIEVELDRADGRLVEVRGFLNEGEVRGLLAGYLRPGRGGLLLFAVTAPEKWPELSPVAGQIARSVRLFDPDPQELIRTWKERLSGFQLVHAPGPEQSGAAGATERTYFLCANGSFTFEEHAESESPAPSARQTGSWDIVARQRWAELDLTFQDGHRQQYRLSRQDHETYLGNQRYFVLSYDSCP